MGTSTDENPTYQYTEPGVYDVTLTVYGVGGTASYTRSGYITVNTPEYDVTLGAIDPADSATLTGLAAYSYNTVCTLEATPTGGGLIDYADIVFMIAQTEANGLSPAMAYVPSYVTSLEAALISAGIGAGATPNNYALVGFESGDSVPADVPTKQTVGGGDWGSAAQLNTAIAALPFPFSFIGQHSDGYWACEFALSDYTFRAGAPKIFVIVTNEGRRTVTGTPATYASSQAALSAASVILNAVVSININVGFVDTVFGRDALTSTVYIDDGAPPYYIGGTFQNWSRDRLDLSNLTVIASYAVWCGEVDGYSWAWEATGGYTGFINAFGEVNAARALAQVSGSYTFDHFTLNGGSNITTNPYNFNVVSDVVVNVYMS